MARENAPGLGARRQHRAVDADDPVAGEDAREVGPRARNHLPHRECSPLVRLQDDAVVRARHEDVDDRQQGESERHAAENRHPP